MSYTGTDNTLSAERATAHHSLPKTASALVTVALPGQPLTSHRLGLRMAPATRSYYGCQVPRQLTYFHQRHDGAATFQQIRQVKMVAQRQPTSPMASATAKSTRRRRFEQLERAA